MTITLRLINKNAYQILRDLEKVHLIKFVSETENRKKTSLWKRKLKQAFKDVEKHESGKLKLKTLNELLDEI